MAKVNPTVSRLNESLEYDPETGNLYWKVSRANVLAGSLAGGPNDQGYILFRLDKAAIRAHIAAWAIMTGAYPTLQIDHINRIRSDNRWNNLRQATHSQNHQNIGVMKSNTHGFRGIEHHESGLWRARLVLNKKRIHIGYFKTPEEASAARIEAEKKYFTHSPVSSPLT